MAVHLSFLGMEMVAMVLQQLQLQFQLVGSLVFSLQWTPTQILNWLLLLEFPVRRGQGRKQLIKEQQRKLLKRKKKGNNNPADRMLI